MGPGPVEGSLNLGDVRCSSSSYSGENLGIQAPPSIGLTEGSEHPAPGRARILVLGIGNLLNSDEGLGVHAVRALQERGLTSDAGIRMVDGGTLGLNLLPLVEECTHLLLLDCVDAGAPGGTQVELDKEHIPLYAGLKMSQHQTTFQEVLALAAIRDSFPERLRLVGIQPVSLEIGTQLSPEVAAAMPAMLDRAESILHSWGVEWAAEGRT
jgi:hydrogenase maturation protease